MKDILNNKKDILVLDKNIDFIDYLIENRKRVRVVSNDRQFIREYKSQEKYSTFFYFGNFIKLDEYFCKESFEMIYCSDILQYLDNIRFTFKTFINVCDVILKNNGILCISKNEYEYSESEFDKILELYFIKIDEIENLIIYKKRG